MGQTTYRPHAGGDLDVAAMTADSLTPNTQTSGTAVQQGHVVKITQTVAKAAFTDGGGASATFALTPTIPAGATFLSSAVTAVTGFAGDTSAVLIIGDGTDTDRYNTGTVNVFTTAAAGVDAGVPSGVKYHATEKTVTLTITSGADWGSVSAGSVTVELYYLT
jgi:hypothetical protein